MDAVVRAMRPDLRDDLRAWAMVACAETAEDMVEAVETFKDPYLARLWASSLLYRRGWGDRMPEENSGWTSCGEIYAADAEWGILMELASVLRGIPGIPGVSCGPWTLEDGTFLLTTCTTREEDGWRHYGGYCGLLFKPTGLRIMRNWFDGEWMDDEANQALSEGAYRHVVLLCIESLLGHLREAADPAS